MCNSIFRSTTIQYIENSVLNYDIVISNLNFEYKYEEYVIEDLSLKINLGDKVIIRGPSGCGKSTLLKLIASIYTPSSGELSIGNISYSRNSQEIRDLISYVDQDTFIFEGSMKENLLLGDNTFNIPEKHLIDILDICDIKNILPQNETIETLKLYEYGNNLSGGQKQKIGIARAIIKIPKILLLDESTSNLDDISKNKLMNYIFSKKDLTVIFVTHDSDSLKFAYYTHH